MIKQNEILVIFTNNNNNTVGVSTIEQVSKEKYRAEHYSDTEDINNINIPNLFESVFLEESEMFTNNASSFNEAFDTVMEFWTIPNYTYPNEDNVQDTIDFTSLDGNEVPYVYIIK